MKWQNNFHGASAGRIWRCSREFAKKSGFLGLSLGFITMIASVGSVPAVFAEGLTLTVPQALSFDVTPNLAESAGTFGKSQESSLSAQTTTAFGYTLSLKLKNDDNSNKLMNGDHFLTSIEAAMTEDQFKSTAAANTWGFLPSKFNKTDNTSYQPGPTTETMLDETDAPDSGTTPYSIGLAAKVNSEAATGSYNNTFVITLTANAVNYTVKYALNGDGASGGPAAPLTGSSVEKTANVKIGSEVPTRDGYEFKGWCTSQTSDENCSGTTIEAGGDLTLNDLKKGNDNTVTLWAMWRASEIPMIDRGELGNMQSFSCGTLKSPSDNGIEYGTVTDTRDNNKYKVARLADGYCWMIENLRIVGMSISNSNSNMSSGSFTIPNDSATSAFQANYGATNVSHAYYDGDTNYGAYYTWYTVTAGSGTSSLTTQNQTASSSICPSGWRLPTSGTSGDFQRLYNMYNTSSKIAVKPVPGFTYAGYIDGNTGIMNGRNIYGRYWSSTVYDSTSAYFLGISSLGIGPTNLNARSFGFSARCLKAAGCFIAGTVIDTPDGQIPIEKIEKGMTVYSYDIENSTVVTDIVTNTFIHNDDRTVVLTFDDGSSIHGSDNHFFYDLDSNQWKKLGDFKYGDKLETVDGGASIIRDIERDNELEVVYNIETEKYHNYFIIPKNVNNRFLVHNYK